MNKVKRLLTSIFTFMLILGFIPVTVSAEEPADRKIIVYTQVPEDWANPCLWAWDDDGTNAFDAWPGEAMEKDVENEGWYYCWIPETATNIIINANNSGIQTADQKIEAQNAWITVSDEENVSVSYEQQTAGDIPEYVETFKVHAKVPDSWESVGLWVGTAPDDANASAEWPGKSMIKGEDGWYTATAPVWAKSIIVNGNNGEVQTEDLSIDAAEIWVTVAEDNTAEFSYEDPNKAEVEDINVYVKVPEDWKAPHLWAWSAPDGTNAFSAWPGEALEDNGDGWTTLSVPGWINSVIVNGNESSIQTGDLSVEAGKDLWIVVTDAENAEVSYEKPDVDITEEAETAKVAEDEGISTTAIVAIVITVLIIVAIAVVYRRKKKNS